MLILVIIHLINLLHFLHLIIPINYHFDYLLMITIPINHLLNFLNQLIPHLIKLILDHFEYLLIHQYPNLHHSNYFPPNFNSLFNHLHLCYQFLSTILHFMVEYLLLYYCFQSYLIFHHFYCQIFSLLFLLFIVFKLFFLQLS